MKPAERPFIEKFQALLIDADCTRWHGRNPCRPGPLLIFSAAADCPSLATTTRRTASITRNTCSFGVR